MRSFKKKTPGHFIEFGERLKQISEQDDLGRLLQELARISEIIYSHYPNLRDICHCGAIDYPSDLLVLFVSNNSGFYLVNNMISNIQDILFSNGVSFSKILVKVRPEQHQPKKVKRVLSLEQREALQKFANALGRPELIKSLQEHEEENASTDWELKL
ncbi:MAG: hypothetical protein EKK54_06710 [Neisseriaceae bacterium]|nr:MAG: hypothetical protein EKK54_06710 [Neisseriaceae bacterium]